MISSAEQLDDIGLPLLLVIVMLDTAEACTADAFCLPDIVNGLRRQLEGNAMASSLFEERLIAAGYIDREEYQSHCIRLALFASSMCVKSSQELCGHSYIRDWQSKI